MPRRVKVLAVLTAVFAVVFWLFFQICKQAPGLQAVNVFGDDPYDAVGSFGVQLTALAALLTLIRAWRPYLPGELSSGQRALLARTAFVAVFSAAVTLLADVVALARYPAVWSGTQDGRVLAGLVGGMALVTALLGWRIHHDLRVDSLPRAAGALALVATLIAVIVLALYPTKWDLGIMGAVLTVVLGALILFALVWAWAMTMAPSRGSDRDDVLDDLAAVEGWLKAHAGLFGSVFAQLERMCEVPWLRRALAWLNPREHAWNAVILIALLMGVALALGEFSGGDAPSAPGRLVMVAAVFIGLEGLAVVIGYVVLARPLWLFRGRA